MPGGSWFSQPWPRPGLTCFPLERSIAPEWINCRAMVVWCEAEGLGHPCLDNAQVIQCYPKCPWSPHTSFWTKCEASCLKNIKLFFLVDLDWLQHCWVLSPAARAASRQSPDCFFSQHFTTYPDPVRYGNCMCCLPNLSDEPHDLQWEHCNLLPAQPHSSAKFSEILDLWFVLRSCFAFFFTLLTLVFLEM